MSVLYLDNGFAAAVVIFVTGLSYVVRYLDLTFRYVIVISIVIFRPLDGITQKGLAALRPDYLLITKDRYHDDSNNL